MALGRLQRVLRNLSQMLLPADPTRPMLGRALLTCVPGEQHTLGLFMVAEMFVREGFDVSVGSPVSDSDLSRSIASTWYDIVGFSLSCDTQLKVVRRAIADVRRLSKNPAVRVLVGGAIVRRHPALAGAVGADRWAPDARVAAQVARTLASKP
jgi:MerR family transcriptional regulator, light-induced transcriptional regulator